jgi:Cu(I)/Ag(I) efflux system membrane protein CusA/SilA
MGARLQLQCGGVVGYIALFGIAVETGVVIVVYLHEALQRRIAAGVPISHDDIHAAGS